MAAGYYDAEGVWIYGESDSIALFSDLLNLGENSISDQFTADRSRLSTLESSIGTRYVAASSTARDSHFGTPANDTQRLALQNSGAECLRTDLGYTERYFATYNASTNPGGATPAGWYPVSGALPILSVTTATAQSIGAAWTTIQFPSAVISEIQNITFNAATGVATVITPGLYRVSGMLTMGASTSGTKAITVYRTGSATTYFGGGAWTTAVTNTVTARGVIKCSAGDTLQLQAYANASTATVGVVSGANLPNGLQIEYVGIPR